jgi:hypothetical protein
LRSITIIFNTRTAAPRLVLPLLIALPAAFAPSSAYAQSANDDLYGVPGAASPAADSANAVTAPRPRRVDTVAAPIAAPADSARTPSAPRPRITRETTINPLDVQKGAYRNPKKALFMSLMIPGLGQAYVGQSTFNYARAAFYFGTEVTLGALWYQYAVVKYDREVKRYRRYADAHWSQGEYEEQMFQASPPAAFEVINPYRASYCDAVQHRDRGSQTEEGLYHGCVDPMDSVARYSEFKSTYDDRNLFGAGANPDSVGKNRAKFADPVEFYALIGRYQEFIAGWDDATGVSYSDSAITGTSAHRDTYAAMRQKAQDYSRMQAWFIGGIVLNHIASAVDAALTARANNKRLYEGEARWYDRLHVDGGLAFEAGRPRTHMLAQISF